MTKGPKKTLAELWLHRDQLSKAEWDLLYQLVWRVLKEGDYSELESLPLPLKNYIDEFFRDKVFLPTTKKTFRGKPLYYDNVLMLFFRRYLIQKIKEIERLKEVPLPDDDNRDDGEDGKKPLIPPELIAPVAQDDAVLLGEYGFTPEQVALSARQFLQKNEEWVRLMIALSFCPDKDKDKQLPIPLSLLAQKYKIPAYYYRARKLGIPPKTVPKKGISSKNLYEFQQDFENTLLGQWLISLGLSISNENQDVIHLAFKILCWEALSIVEEEIL